MRAFIKQQWINRGFRMVPNCWINVECPTEAEKKYVLDELKFQKHFTMTLKI
jgi:magnesium transporter